MVRDVAAAREPARARSRALRVHRRVAARVRGVGLRRGQPATAARPPALRARCQDALRARLHAPRIAARGTRPRCRTRCVPVRRLRVRGAHGLLRRGRRARGRTALRQHRRLRRGRRGAALPAPRPAARRAAPLVPDRRGRPVPRLRQRHHPHLVGRRRGILGLVGAMDALQQQLCAGIRAGSRLPRRAPRSAPGDRRPAARRGHRRLRRRYRRRRTRHQRVLPARHRPPARPAGARRRGPRRRCDRRARDPAPGRATRSCA